MKLSSQVATKPELRRLNGDSQDVTGLVAEPARLQLRAGELGHVLITARLKDGFDVDATGCGDASARLRRTCSSWKTEARCAAVSRERRRSPRRSEISGSRFPWKSLPAATEPPGFVRDVLPVLSKAGCNAGACHAKPDGQNGFHLTVFSYDPQSDYDEIVKHARGRRVFPSSPAESLILLKATLTVPHEGGERFDKNSDAYRTLVQWIRGGLVYRAEQEPELQRISVFPRRTPVSQRRHAAAARSRPLFRWLGARRDRARGFRFQ